MAQARKQRREAAAALKAAKAKLAQAASERKAAASTLRSARRQAKRLSATARKSSNVQTVWTGVKGAVFDKSMSSVGDYYKTIKENVASFNEADRVQINKC